jgi:four helix bundle protein
MGGIERFEDVEAWREARSLGQTVYRLTHGTAFAKDVGLCGQVQRAAVSIMANIAEGFDSGSDREFLRFLGYALRSASELQSHLYVALDQCYLDEESFTSACGHLVKVKSLIGGFTRYLRTGKTGN